MKKINEIKKIVITGGGGYVGSKLVPFLIHRGYEVTVLDLFLYGKEVFKEISTHPNLYLVSGDIRNLNLLKKTFHNQDCLIHLACISNDPSFDLDPNLGKSINYDSFNGILAAVNESSIQRLIYASSSSVYGVSSAPRVTEDTECNPLTDYSKYKLLCEDMLKNYHLKNCIYTIISPATVCGYAPRLRLDLTVNILTIQALVNKKMTVFGGNQLRPHVFINDIVEAYCLLIESQEAKVASRTFNAGYENRSVSDTACIIKEQIQKMNPYNINISVAKSNDHRSYHIDSSKIYNELGFKPQYDLYYAVQTLCKAFNEGLMENPLENSLYYNIKRMKEVDLK